MRVSQFNHTKKKNQADFYGSAQVLTTELSSTGNELQGVNVSPWLTNQLHVMCREAKIFFPHLQSNCITEALECITAELQNVRKECKDPEEVIDQTEEFLTDIIIKRGKGKVSVQRPG